MTDIVPLLVIERHPNILWVALEVAYDNGMINRLNSEGEFIAGANHCCVADGVTSDDLQRLEDWLASLTEAQRYTIACGEDTDQKALEALAPRGGEDNVPLTGLFTDIFESPMT